MMKTLALLIALAGAAPIPAQSQSAKPELVLGTIGLPAVGTALAAQGQQCYSGNRYAGTQRFWETVTVDDLVCDPNARVNRGDTPLHMAAEHSAVAIVETLLSAGADPNGRNEDGETPLHRAARHRSDGAVIVESLLAAGVDPKARDNDGDTPLHMAVRVAGDDPRAVEALLAAGANPNTRNDDGVTPLRGLRGDAAMVVLEVLLAAGADPNARPGDGLTLLHLMAAGGRLEVVEKLLAAGADPNARAKDGRSPLHYASEWSDDGAIIEALLAAGADPNARESNEGRTPLHLAALVATDDAAIIEALLAAGADPNARDQNGLTPATFHSYLRDRTAPGGGPRAAATAPRGRCLIPGFPDPADPESLGLPWCPASVDFQIRVFAISAAGAQCAIATGSSSTPEQIEARNRETADLCGRLDGVAERFGGAACRCPADWR